MTTNPYIPGIAELAYYDPADLARLKLRALARSEPKDVPPATEAMMPLAPSVRL